MIVRLLPSLSALLVPAALVGQVATVGADTLAAADPDEVRGRARGAQATFERVRLRYAPLRFGSSAIDCDEVVGRLCTTYHEGEWYPRPESEEVVEARARLVRELDDLQGSAPADGWILGQRVWYRADAGDWESALHLAEECGEAEPWWCAALEGLSLHGLGRYAEAEESFGEALDGMDQRVATQWRVPERAVDREARNAMREWREKAPAELDHRLAAVWALADPLYLVEGNDRLTAHYARWTVSEIKRDARNPYGLSWADDLEELTVRHGWEIGYERTRNSVGLGREGATGHKHPEGRDFLPSGQVLLDPQGAEAGDLVPDRRRPRSLYAPAYAPVLLPVDAQVAVFPRGEEAIVVVAGYLPEDTSFHAGHDHPLPWMDPGDQADMPDRHGLFALLEGAAAPAFGETEDGSDGALLLELSAGSYVVSYESWSPSRRVAGRFRAGLVITAVTPDVAIVSDLLLLTGGAPEPTSLEQALPRVLPRARIEPGAPLGVVWELSGLGFRAEALEYAVSVERTDRNVFSRIGDFLGISERPRALALSWEEPGPEQPGRAFRYLDLDLPPVDPGEYEITLTLSTQGRSDVVARRSFEVVEP